LTGEREPDYASCIAISTEASIKKMVAPGILVIGSPFAVGVFFGPNPIVGLLLGLLVSGV
jgi:Na+/H+-translocating membrane pyrophosphatase